MNISIADKVFASTIGGLVFLIIAVWFSYEWEKRARRRHETDLHTVWETTRVMRESWLREHPFSNHDNPEYQAWLEAEVGALGMYMQSVSPKDQERGFFTSYYTKLLGEISEKEEHTALADKI
jgi:hypothetical protein